jgi:predicted lipid-binding transport protein (Tim44 family)
MYDVILYAAIATIVCVMLYSVLGKSVGRGPEDDADLPDFITGKDRASEPKIVAPVYDGPHLPGLEDILKLDADFSPVEFLGGARVAYPMILEAFADGDKETLSPLLSPDVYQVYADAIEAREAQNLRQITDLARLIGAEFVGAETSGKEMRVSVRYKAELASALVNEAGDVIEGDPDTLASINEIWTFTRTAGSKDPNWLLADVAPSEGDELAADPTPDTSA